MLPAKLRLRRSGDYTATVKGGSRAARAHLVVHLLLDEPVGSGDIAPFGPLVSEPARAGFVVSKAVGGSVTRHAVVRRLRPLVAARLGSLPTGTRIVVRALPPSAAATSLALDRDLESALAKALSREQTRMSSGGGACS